MIDFDYHISTLTWLFIFIVMPISATYVIEKIIIKTGNMPKVTRFIDLVIDKFGNQGGTKMYEATSVTILFDKGEISEINVKGRHSIKSGETISIDDLRNDPKKFTLELPKLLEHYIEECDKQDEEVSSENMD